MFRIKDIRGESIVVADGFVEKSRLFMSLMVRVGQRGEADALIAELEKARAAQA